MPAACDSGEPPEDERVCRAFTEKDLTLYDLTFEPVPEPAVVWLVAAGVVARARPRRKI